MTKTPEQMALEYAAKEGKPWGCEQYFLAGYQAAQHKDKAVNRTHLAWKLAEDYGAVKWLKHKDPKRFGNTERDYEYIIARDGFYQGYQAAVNSPEKPDSCEHILDMEKMVDVNSSSGWISVKDRLPPPQTEVLWWNKTAHQAGVSSWEYMSHCNDTMLYWGDAGNVSIKNFTHWMSLPKQPEEEK